MGRNSPQDVLSKVVSLSAPLSETLFLIKFSVVGDETPAPVFSCKFCKDFQTSCEWLPLCLADHE